MSEILYLIIPAYNEEANLEETIREWYPVVERHDGGGLSRLVIVNDGSKDRTGEIAAGCMADRPYLTVLTQQNAGHGAAVRNGYRYAVESGADYVFQTDSDGQTLASEFEPFWEMRKEVCFQHGIRRKRQDGAGRVFTTKVLKAVVRLIFRARAEDANVPYRLMDAASLAELLPFIPEGESLTNVFLTVLYLRTGKTHGSHPITFRPRQGGVNSINWKRIFSIGRNALHEFRALDRTLRENGF